jgi:hypothetical protein
MRLASLKQFVAAFHLRVCRVLDLQPRCRLSVGMVAAEAPLRHDTGTREGRAQATWSDAAPQGRWRPYSYDEIVKRDKCSLDIFWLKDESLEDSENLPDRT